MQNPNATAFARSILRLRLHSESLCNLFHLWLSSLTKDDVRASLFPVSVGTDC